VGRMYCRKFISCEEAAVNSISYSCTWCKGLPRELQCRFNTASWSYSHKLMNKSTQTKQNGVNVQKVIFMSVHAEYFPVKIYKNLL
jgi:hypothetical protein